MSKISLKHSGGNVVSLNSPTSAPTSADVAFKLPNADGSAGQFMKTDGSGNLSFDTVSSIIRQHKILSKTTKSSTASTSISIIPDFSITITPTASDSIMIVEANMMYSIANHVITTRILNDTTSTSILIQPATFDSNDDGNSSLYGSNDRMNHQHITAFETAGNTNARTYNVGWRVSSGTAYINRYYGSDSYNSVSVLRVTEVAP